MRKWKHYLWTLKIPKIAKVNYEDFHILQNINQIIGTLTSCTQCSYWRASEVRASLNLSCILPFPLPCHSSISYKYISFPLSLIYTPTNRPLVSSPNCTCNLCKLSLLSRRSGLLMNQARKAASMVLRMFPYTSCPYTSCPSYALH